MSDKRITEVIIWAQNRLDACDRTERTSKSQRSRDWAYGESVAIRAILGILADESGRGYSYPAHDSNGDGDAFGGREFYELMQSYRHSPLTDFAGTTRAFEKVKEFIRSLA